MKQLTKSSRFIFLLRRLPVLILNTAAFVLCTSCSTLDYDKIPVGELHGKLTLEWVGPDQFIYRPDAQDPFYFKRANGEIIKPRSVFTDGGSIPRHLWAFRGYSPWGFGSAYIAHDWLFSAHHCGYPEANNQTVFTAADVLSECIKTLMERDKNKPESLRNPSLLLTIDQAVRSKIAQDLWNSGKCIVPPSNSPEGRNFRFSISRGTIDPARLPRMQTRDFDAE
jgi:hypothetical protein